MIFIHIYMCDWINTLTKQNVSYKQTVESIDGVCPYPSENRRQNVKIAQDTDNRETTPEGTPAYLPTNAIAAS